MLEWLKRHAWKACNRQNRFAGSNPVLSASFISVQLSPCRRRAVFLYSVFLLSHTSGGGCDNAKLIARCPYRRLRLPLSSLFFLRKHHDFTISPFHDFTNSRFHKFTNSQIHKFTNSQIHDFTNSQIHKFTNSHFRFLRKHHDFTFSPHQSPETMLSPLISPLRQAEIHELVIVQRRGDTRR